MCTGAPLTWRLVDAAAVGIQVPLRWPCSRWPLRLRRIMVVVKIRVGDDSTERRRFLVGGDAIKGDQVLAVHGDLLSGSSTAVSSLVHGQAAAGVWRDGCRSRPRRRRRGLLVETAGTAAALQR